jgi:hypothetical protein
MQMSKSQGDAILEFLSMPKELTLQLSKFIKMHDIQRIQKSVSFILLVLY